ncbi:RNA polymerase III RPC4-domain-containing protein [Kickxella alabastrina]|uniref:RNA polymerase III RPC4-domain-containing protein n=1 Tax=Kickxella alabastrina TaxID=61397 RepID=UPI00221ECCF2|nr:RNA polymerase III RPC4-domain-containing protein [Kickxella alabastrina]XP_051388963.1 RNA polymerase III RPC4-domain-containing protein [Kickxella alabastrina]KAI7821296.1 RNA polymerase III RPC4-domain-containing protein [Kickxella alabastrina]KAI7821303.1 RNA polymerase III RPC4-domain-containing protein [Kickxella alabastrina]
MPDIPPPSEAAADQKPQLGSMRGGSSLRGRGRGRGGGLPSASGSIPNERLHSIRERTTAAAGVPGASVSGRGKMVFTPNVPARRNKKEPSALLLAKPVVEAITGPFAQGPASLSSGGSSRRGMGGGGGGSGSALLPPGVSGVDMTSAAGAKPESGFGVDDSRGGNSDSQVVMVTDHNDATAVDALEVQTEEMAISAAEEMGRLKLDFGAASFFTAQAKAENGDCSGELAEGLEDKMMVFQVPELPIFELAPEVLQRRLTAKQRKIARAAGRSAEAKPSVVDLDADVKPDIAKLELGVDIKPDLSKLDISDDTPDADDNGELDEGEANGDLADGRIGTLVVLKSGAVRMKIGDILLDVSRGANCQFMRGLFALDTSATHTAFMLGNVDQQFMCTPDLDSII